MKADSRRERLALALDLPLPDAEQLYARLAPYFGVAKIGLSLFVEHGPAAVERLRRLGARIFLDLKLHDIPNTVELAARHAAESGASFITVHAQGGPAMMRAARAGAEQGAPGSPPKVLAVTVLTSLSAEDLSATGHVCCAAELAERLARLAMMSGLAGVVCSPREVGQLRRSLGPGAFLCTPGIRPPGTESADQVRTATAADAARAGADLLIVGRPVYSAADPLEAARALAAELAGI